MTRSGSRGKRKLAVGVLLLAVGTFGLSAVHAADIAIGYLQLQDDRRYAKKRNFARFLMQALGNPVEGAKVALKEVKFIGKTVGVEFELKHVERQDAAGLVAAVKEMVAGDLRYFLIDAPADVVAEVAKATRGQDVLLFNVSARDDGLRQEQCQSHLLHVIPNYGMLTDALMQYLTFKKWREMLVLEGPRIEDRQFTAALARSAKRYGVKIVDKRPFVLSNDPRERDRNNVALLTGGVDYDVVFVADTDGEFAREVPYQTVKPRPVVGTEGLAAQAWHWSWERHGAPQLEKRFEKRAKRAMTSFDWAAWMAVKGLGEAVLRTQGGDFPAIRDYLLGDEVILDGFKGNRGNFRPWDRQLRQPLLITTHNWVVERAPIRGFLHAKNNLDTLGFDERDSKCKF